MTGALRLRQVCLVAPALAEAEAQLCSILGLRISYRDPHVGKYGLENSLMPIDDVLLEVVSPTRDGTAAGRFIEKSNGRGGYMAIFSCADPDKMAADANSIGLRTANAIDHPPYHGMQLHPRDCRAAFIEFNHTKGSDNIYGPYPPAGPDWHTFIAKDVTLSLTSVELQSPKPEELAAHWGRILQMPVLVEHERAEIVLPNATLSFAKGDAELMSAITVKVVDRAVVLQRAADAGVLTNDDSFFASGVEFRLT